MTKYTTMQGDTWDIIAKKTTGSEYNMDKIMKVNLEYLDVVVFSADIVLNIPDVEKRGDYTILPPWKQVGGKR